MSTLDRYTSKDVIFTDTFEVELEESFFRGMLDDALLLPRRYTQHGIFWDPKISYSDSRGRVEVCFSGHVQSAFKTELKSKLSVEIKGSNDSVAGWFAVYPEVSIFHPFILKYIGDKGGSYTVIVTALFALSLTLVPTNSQLERLMMSEILDASDLTLTVENKQIQVHKSILLKLSSVFSAMFDHDTKESRDNNIDIVDFNFEAVNNSIDYIYGKNVFNLTTEKATEMHRFCDKYMIECAANKLFAWLKSNISINNFWVIQKYAWKVSQDELKNACIRFYRGNTTLTLSKEFRQLDNDVMRQFFEDN